MLAEQSSYKYNNLNANLLDRCWLLICSTAEHIFLNRLVASFTGFAIWKCIVLHIFRLQCKVLWQKSSSLGLHMLPGQCLSDIGFGYQHMNGLAF